MNHDSGDSHAIVPSGDDGNHDDRLTTDLVAGLTRGSIDPLTLDPHRRRDCVDYLDLRGFSVTESAQLLRVTERTIHRDRAINRSRGAMQPSATLGDELMGRLQQTIAASNQRLTRLASADETPPYVKVWAENTIVRNCTALIDKAKELGYYRDARERLGEVLDDDPGEKRRKTKDAARRRAMDRGMDPDAPPPFDPTCPIAVLEDTGVERAVEHARARLTYLELVLATDTTEQSDEERAELARCLDLIRHTRAGLDQAAESLHDTVTMERGYSWYPNDSSHDDDDDASDDTESNASDWRFPPRFTGEA